jgi:MFS family permease
MDISSEMVHSLLPIYMSAILGASMLTIGLVEGIAEGTASVMKLFSGVLSDIRRERKPLVLLGYGLSALTKPAFPLASSITWVAAARFTDRIGKGIRETPRDALMADVTPPKMRGSAYGLRQALDSVGAFVGPLAAIALMILLNNRLKAVLWLAAIPAAIALLMLIGVSEPKHSAAASSTSIRLRDAGLLGRDYWRVVILAVVFTLARFSDAFLILRAQNVGIPVEYVPLVLVAMNTVYAAIAYPAGKASDTMDHRKLLHGGLLALIAADVILAVASAPGVVLIGAAVWGLHFALTQGLLSKLVADAAPSHLRGSAFGIFNLFMGASTLLASLIAGALWSWLGPTWTFGFGAVFATAAVIGLGWHRNVALPPGSLAHPDAAL